MIFVQEGKGETIMKQKGKTTMTHKIKILEQFAIAILKGDKTFEVRENDRGYQKGDILHFVPIDELGVRSSDIAEFEATVTYVLSGWGLKEGYVALGIKLRKETDNE
jgi:hypothetical protein